MPRPRRDTTDGMLRYFLDMPVDAQAELLKQLNLLHWAAKIKATKQPEPEQQAELDIAEGDES